MSRRGTQRTSDPVRRLRRTRRLGSLLMTASLAGGTVLASLSPAAAQEAPEGAPEDAQEVTVEATAHYTYPVGDALPPTATSEFPPGVVCIVAPEFCPEELAPVSDAVAGGIGAVKDNEPTPPADPMAPGDLPVGIVGGTKHYESALKFEVPNVPEGDEVAEFLLVLTENQPTYHSSSPAFRQAVLAALTCARECDEEQFNKIMEQEGVENAVIGVEACPFTEPFEEGGSQEPPEDQPIDCIYGANAERLEGGIWIVDLTFTVQAWQDGSLENHGILLRPTGAPNLAYGDPDATTNAQVTFSPEVMAASETAPAPEPPPAFDDSASASGDAGVSSGGSSGSGGTSSGGGFSSSPSGGVSGDPFSPPASQPADEAPLVADSGGAPVDDGGAASSPETAPVAGVLDESDTAGSAWWMWLLVPVFAAGTWMTAQSLTAEATVAGTRERAGAMSRLIAQKAAERAGTGTPMTQV